MQRWLLQVNSVFPQGRERRVTVSARAHTVSPQKKEPHARNCAIAFQFERLEQIREPFYFSDVASVPTKNAGFCSVGESVNHLK